MNAKRERLQAQSIYHSTCAGLAGDRWLSGKGESRGGETSGVWSRLGQGSFEIILSGLDLNGIGRVQRFDDFLPTDQRHKLPALHP